MCHRYNICNTWYSRDNGEQVNDNREYLAPQFRSMNNRFHSEAKLPWSYDYPLANHIATNKSSASREMTLFSRLYPSLGIFGKFSRHGV